METAISKLTSKYQATVPEAVRRLLKLKAGDAIAFDIEDHLVRVRKARAVDSAFANAVAGTLCEWDTEVDEEAYRDL